MSKEEFLKIQTCVLKVNIHCDGCKHKVKKILQKIEGVYTTKIDAEQGKVTVSGNVDPSALIKKLAKSGKHAEIWGSKPLNNNQNNMNNQFKNMQIDNGKGINKGQKSGGGGNGNNNQLPKGGGGGNPNPQQMQQLQQLQQLSQMKGFQDLKLPQFKDMKLPLKPPNQNQPMNNHNQKSVKFNLPDYDDDITDDEFDDDYDDEDDYDDDDDFEDDEDDIHHPPNKMKPIMVNGSQAPNMMMMNAQAKNGGNGIPNGGNNGKKGGGNGGGGLPVQINDGKNGGKKNGNIGNGGNQNQGGSSGKNGAGAGGGNIKNGNQGGGAGGNGAKKGGGMCNGGAQPMSMSNGLPNMGGGSSMGQNNMNMQMGQLGNMPRGGGQMGNMPAVQGLPASGMPPGGGGAGYFQGGGPEFMAGNPLQQQQLAAAMNQRAMGNERFQPMMYARPPPAVNYMPAPYPYPYPYPQQHHPQPPPNDTYTDYFSDENTSSCNVM